MHDELDLNLEPSEPSSPDVGQAGASMPQGQVDHEGAMAKADLYKLANYSLKLFKKIQDGDQLEGWVQAKITKAADYIASVYHYLEYEMQFSEYGKKLDNSDVLSEGQKAALKNKLMEARAKVKELKLAQAEKQFGLEEGILSGGEQPCPECGGSGHVMVAPRAVPEELKNKVKSYNRKAKAYAAATKRIDANKNGIPDDEEMEESAADEPAAPNAEAIAKRKAREAAQRRREEKEEADYDDLSKDVKPKGEKSSGTKKVAGKAYGGSAQKDDSEKEVDEGQGGIYGKGVYEGKSKKAKKDYDKDGKIESEKDEVIGSRRKAAGLDEAAKPDYIDLDKDGNKKETMKKAAADKKKVKEAAEEKRAPAKKTTRTVDLPSGAKGKVTKVQGWQSQKAEKEAKKDSGLDEAQPMPPMPDDGSTAPPPKGKDGQYPIVTSGPNKGKRWSPQTPGPTNPVFKESAELDRMKEFLTRLNG